MDTSGEELTLFRIVQEAFSNIVRHARARQVILRFRREEKASETTLLLEVTDDGAGFDPRREEQGMGLASSGTLLRR